MKLQNRLSLVVSSQILALIPPSSVLGNHGQRKLLLRLYTYLSGGGGGFICVGNRILTVPFLCLLHCME